MGARSARQFGSSQVTAGQNEAAGQYEVMAVRYGTRETRKSDVFLNFDVYGEPDARMQMDYFFWVARNSQRSILVDCGFNERSGLNRGRTMLCPPVEALRRLGIAPSDIGMVIVTHAHYDHIGNLAAFAGAELVMSEREYDFWTGALASRPLFASTAEAEDIDFLRRAKQAGRIRFTGRAGEPVADGIEIIEVGGHTPGQLLVLISTTGGQAVIASDALHYYEEMERDRPFRHVTDLPAMYAAYDLLRDLCADGTRQLVAGHDPDVARRFNAGDDAEFVTRIS